jgi:hypothetical protein
MSWLTRLFRKSKLERRLDSELRFHVEQQTTENIAAGMNPDEARRSAWRNSAGWNTSKKKLAMPAARS